MLAPSSDSDDDACAAARSSAPSPTHATVEAAHAASVASLRRLTELQQQLLAIRLSYWLQLMNFAKFACDLGCALPMALNVHSQWDGVVQFTGTGAAAIGLVKLFIVTKPAT